MRLVLRNYEQLSYSFKKNNYSRTSNRNQVNLEGTPQNSQYSNKLHYGARKHYDKKANKKHYQINQGARIGEEFDPQWLKMKKRQMSTFNSPHAGSVKLEGTWQYVADSLMIKDYDYLKPQNKNETAQQLIQRYENNLKLSMEKHLMPKLYEDDRYIKKMAKYHASEMGPLTASFLRQGYNFLDKKLIIHLLTTQNVKTIKQLFLGGAFQTAECIDDEVVVHILARFQQHQRNHFLINLLSYHVQLLTGQVRIETVKNFDAQVAEDVNQRQFIGALYKSNGSTSINKLRLLWSFQRRYLHKFNLMEFIVPQLKKITFLVKNPEEQILVNKEVNHVMSTFFESEIFQTIFFNMFQTTQTFPNFFKAWAFTFLIFSKLRAIPTLLDSNSNKELHSIFQLIEMNLPSEIAEQFMKSTVFNMLLQDEQNTIALQNYFTCLHQWKSDYIQPPTTLYNTPLTSILSQNSPTVTISYRQHDKSDQFATTTVVLNRKNIEEKSAIVTQSQVIHNLLKGNYQSVFDDFLVRYSLPSDFDRATKFQMKLKQADKTLSFQSKDQQALYKLKLAYNFFFIESLPKPLKKQDLQPYKMNLGVASLLDGALFKGKQILDNQDYKQVQKFRSQLDRYYKEKVFSQLQMSGTKQKKSSKVQTGKQAQEEKNMQKKQENSQSELIASEQIKEQVDQNLKQNVQQKYQQVSQEGQTEHKGTQYYLDMLRTNKKKNIDKKILYLNDQVAIMLEELVRDKVLTYDFFHKLREQPRPQRIKEINQLIKKYNKYYMNKLDRQNMLIEREEYEEDRKIRQMPFDSQEQRREYALKKIKENTAELKEEVFTLRRQINQVLQQWKSLEDQIFQENSQSAEQQNQIVMNQKQYKQGKQLGENVQSYIQITIDEEFQQFVQDLAQHQHEENIIESALQFKELRKLQKQIISQSEEKEFIDNEYNNFVSRVIESQENQSEQTQIDGARDDRALYFAKNFHYIHSMEKFKNNRDQEEAIAPIELQQPAPVNEKAEGQVSQVEGKAKTEVKDEGLFAAEKEAQTVQSQVVSRRTLQRQQLFRLRKQMSYISNELLDFLQPIQYFEQEMSLDQLIRLGEMEMYQTLREMRYFKKKIEYESQGQSEDHYKDNNRGWKKQRSHMFSKQNRFNQQPADENNKKREVGFFKKIKSGFCTVNSTPSNQEKADVPITNIFDIQHIPKYRNQEVSKEFFNLMQLETHIPRIGDGNIIAKYLFLQGRKDGSKGQVDPKKIMTIQFSTVVGTRSKSYENYIKNTLYSYPLQDYFYKSLLEDQLKLYNRNQFKMIVAHIIHFKDTIPDELITLICQITEKHLIGYSLVQIAQFIKANGIKLSSEALEKVVKVWQRFDIINEDLLPFIKEYCAKVDIPFKTQFYSHFCRSLIVTKKFDKLQALCDLVFAEIRPKPFKISSTAAANEVEILQKAWKQRQNEQFIRLYLQLLEVIVLNLDTSKVPEFVIQLYEDYIKLRTTLNEKQLAYGMVCFCLKKDKFQQLLVYLQRHPELGTSFMYDCTLQALLSNFEELQEFAERILEASVIKNRLVLTNQQILKTINIFKKAATSNAFSKFLEHSLRFQTDIDKQQDIKKQMFYVLNHNVQEVSVAGIFNLLDFIFSDKRERERVQYRALMLAEEQKEKRLHEIQKQAIKIQESKGRYQEKTKADKKEEKHKESEVQSEKSEASTIENPGKIVPSKKKAEKAEKQLKKQKIQKKMNQNQMIDQILSDQQSLTSQANRQLFSTTLNDDDIVSSIRSQSKKNESYKRKGVRGFGKMYESMIQGMQSEEAAIRQKQEKVKMGAKDEKGGKKPAKSKK